MGFHWGSVGVPLALWTHPPERVQVCKSCVRVKGVKNDYVNTTAEKHKE